jgi:hypothetical protein
MQNRNFWFWINLFVGGAGGVMGAFAIGMMVGSGWMHFWPVSLRIPMGVGSVLVTISAIILKRQAKAMDKFVQKRLAEGYARKDSDDANAENCAQ